MLCDKQNNTWACVDMEFIFSCLARHLTRSLCSFVSYRVKHEKRNSISTRARVLFSITCSEKCARRDWSERVHYISIKHAPYVTRVHCWDIMHARTSSVRASAIHDTFYKRSKQTYSSSIVELYKHLGIFKKTREVREAIVLGSFFSALLSCS